MQLTVDAPHSTAEAQPPKQTETGRIPSLDGLRGVAICMVLLGHGAYSLPAILSPVLRFAGNGALGVNIFFVLSGYLIYSLSVREIERTGAFDWRQFYVRRALRIFPCFYCYIAVVLGLVVYNVLTLAWPIMISAATFSLNYRHLWDHSCTAQDCSDYFVVGHYWTLALEEQFYLTWPLLMLLFLRRRLLPALVAIIVLAPCLRIACYFGMPESRGQIGMMFHTGFDSIAAGVLLGELTRRTRTRAYLENLAGNWKIVWGAIVFLVFISPVLAERFRGAYSLPVGKTLELVCLCVVVIAAVTQKGSLLFAALNWRPLAYIGVLSYSLYVWNNLFLYSSGPFAVNVFPWNYVCVIGMGLLSFYLIERPVLRFKERLHRVTPSSKFPLGFRSNCGGKVK